MERMEQKELVLPLPSSVSVSPSPPIEFSSQTTGPELWNSHSSAAWGRVVEEVFRCAALRRGGKPALHTVSLPDSLNESLHIQYIHTDK